MRMVIVARDRDNRLVLLRFQAGHIGPLNRGLYLFLGWTKVKSSTG